jgi:ABC transport system ATP-binding/permease protein
LNSKILFLMILSFIQSLLYVLLSITILDIPDIGIKFFFILFSLSCFANILGLTISASMRSIIAVYITIPLILIPQLLLSGTVVNFDDLHYSISSKKYVPVVGDLMASRWGFEALMVEQFKNNEYEKIFYKLEKELSDYSYIQYNIIPILVNNLTDCKKSYDSNKEKLIINGLEQIALVAKLRIPDVFNLSDTAKIDEGLDFLKKCKEYISNKISTLVEMKDKLTIASMQNFKSKEAYLEFRNRHFNENIARIVKRDNIYSSQVIIYDNQLIRKKEPIFDTPENKFGRSHFYAPIKRIGNLKIDTFWFNLIVIWLMWFMLYLFLIVNLPNKLDNILNNLKIKNLSI